MNWHRDGSAIDSIRSPPLFRRLDERLVSPVFSRRWRIVLGHTCQWGHISKAPRTVRLALILQSDSNPIEL
jgi:hypothetical protein